MTNAPIQIVWFKRDLRVRDHAPLAEAARRGPVLPLFIVEPDVVLAPDYAPRHWSFTRDSLLELRAALAQLGQPLVVRVGAALDVLRALRAEHTVGGLWAHEETGNGVTYARDRAVRRYCKETGLRFTEIPQHGVVRRLADRDLWAAEWERRMRQPLTPLPPALRPVPGVDPGAIPEHQAIGLMTDTCATQAGGAAAGHALLESFLYQRGAEYQRAMSSPLTADVSCSRLSPHLAYGTLALREVVQQTRDRAAAQRDYGTPPGSPEGNWRRSLAAFESRLHWHCHFMQKLEDEPAIERVNMVRAYDGMREPFWDEGRYQAWAAGQTGYPLIDGCVRALAATGWINFRMRAMLVSFASYHLWLHWVRPSDHLARLFTDYEPGIHICQHQMQSGTAGNATVRIYNPTKQAQDQDPDGAFIRRWVPELAGVPDSFIHAPWLLPEQMQRAAGCVIGRHYPAPIVAHEAAVARARAAIGAVRRKPEYAAEQRAVRERHGSRRPAPQRPRKPAADGVQLRLEL